jgi:hypothetical protein
MFFLFWALVGAGFGSKECADRRLVSWQGVANI